MCHRRGGQLFFFFLSRGRRGWSETKKKVMHQRVVVMTEANDFGSLGVGNPPNLNLRQVLKRSMDHQDVCVSDHRVD